MAKATRHLHHNEEQYVAKMNFRSERILQSQIDRLNREKLLQVKSLNAQMRNYERKLQKINERVLEVERLSQNSADPHQRPPTREHFKKLSSDAVRQRHMTTGVGYSYIDNLLGSSRPLVNRSLRWGINPSIPSLQRESLESISFANASSKTFVTEIKGQPIYLRPREAVFLKQQKQSDLVLPQIVLNAKQNEAPKQKHNVKTVSFPNLSHTKEAKVQFTDETKSELSSQEVNPHLPPILENEIEGKPLIPKGKIGENWTIGIGEERDYVTDELLASEACKVEDFNSKNTSENRETEKIRIKSPENGLSLGTPGVKQFTRSSETLTSEKEELETAGQHDSENKVCPPLYKLRSRRFSL